MRKAIIRKFKCLCTKIGEILRCLQNQIRESKNPNPYPNPNPSYSICFAHSCISSAVSYFEIRLFRLRVALNPIFFF